MNNIIALPDRAENLLLHSCCAPCAGEIMRLLHENGIKYTILFYNPNIHPKKEYELRKDENKRYADKLGIDFIDLDYERELWFKRAKSLEFEPERGIRCTMCFDMRFDRTALYAYEHGFDCISSTLAISRWKDMQQINHCGVKAASYYPEMIYWDYNWRLNNGSKNMLTLSKKEQFYQQEYCGCVYSLRDTNKWREENGRDRIKMGVTYYQED